MGEKYLGDLLVELDKVYPYSLTVNELKQKDISSNTILDAMHGELIRTSKRPDEEYDIDARMPCCLTAKGFEYLNQIRMKKTLQQLDASIKDLNDSSNKAYNQLHGSIKEFNESSHKASKYLAKITLLLFIFTVFLVYLTIIELFASWLEKVYGDKAPFVIITLIIFSLIIVLVPLYKEIKFIILSSSIYHSLSRNRH